MISLNELLKDHKFEELLPEHQKNIQELLIRMNKLRVVRAQSMFITSGFRSSQDQIRIYRAKGISIDKIPMGSAHLKGAACDVSDPDGSLMIWTKANESLLQEIGLWVEDDTTEARVHYQIKPPASKSRFFKP